MLPEYSVTYGGNDLSEVDGVTLYNHEFNNLPHRELKINKLARQDKSIITTSEYTQKEIPVYLEACGGSRGGTEQVLTAVKALLQGQNKILQVAQSGLTVQYTSTMNEFNTEWDGITAVVEIIFIASDPIGTDTTTNTLFTTTITTSVASVAQVVEGSFNVEPTINLTVSAVTGGTGGSITISNGLTRQGITITRTFTAGDFISIDSQSKVLTVNGAVTDFTGIFPVFYPGTQALGYVDTFTTRSVSLSSTYQKRLV